MGRLLSFLGGAAKSLAGSIDQDRLEQKRIEDDERQFAKQVSWAKAAEAIRANMQTKTAIPTPSPFGAPIKDASGNWVQPTKTPVGALLDEQTGDVVRPAALEDGPSVPTMDPNALKPYEAAKLEDSKLNRESREKAARIRASGGGSGGAAVGEDGLTPYQREQLKRTDAREERLSKQEGKGGEKPENVRKLWDDEITRASELEGRALMSKAKQYGIESPKLEGIGAAPPVDEEAIRNALLDKIDAKYGGRLKSGGASGGAGVDKPSEASAAQLKPPPRDVLSQAQNAIKNGASAESVRERLRKNGYSDEGI